ncbi:YciI family protein [Luteimonas granuli]|uniref:YCII-related domain-containing protein n=1 Tax=Luteimonas granuli TaxID=1176533 RepID=A0A518N4R8_9GAMM|nr:YciI family protein [Luteimonas granuli]QDW66898.1 hypothetical protein FPZ22_08345 [Luteimonas granuli]
MNRSGTVRPLLLAGLVALAGASAMAQDAPGYDAALAGKLGADDYGMARYVLVILRSGPTPMPKGEARDAMFQGHFANITRLAEEGKLVLAGPLDGVDGRRGIFVLDTADLEEARALVATDPVIAEGEMVADLHVYYGSAALRMVNETHQRIARKAF